MEVFEAIKTRRSIRHFLNKSIPKEDLNVITEAGLYAPSAHGTNPFEFIIVTEKNSINALSKTQKWSAFLKNSSAVIVILADESKSQRHFLEDSSAAIQNILLAARAKGLGACWNAVFSPTETKREEYVRKTLHIPEKYRVIANIGLGFTEKDQKEKDIADLKNNIHYEMF